MNFEEYISPQVQKWLYAFKTSSWHRTVMPYLFGIGLGFYQAEGHRYGPILLGLLFCAAGSIFVNLVNDLYDAKVDAIKRQMFPENTSPKTVPDGLILREHVFNGAIISGLAALAISVLGAIFFGLAQLPVYAIICGAVFIAYTLPPIKLNYRGGGELLEMVGLGFAVPLFGAYIGSDQAVRLVNFYETIPILLPFWPLVFAKAIGRSLEDEESDRAGGKTTVATLLGNKKAKAIAEYSLVVGAALLIMLNALSHRYHPAAFGPLLLIFGVAFFALRGINPKAVTNAFPEIERYERVLQYSLWAYASWVLVASIALPFWFPVR
jgi:1,4-dihydroxy-2-naphthoate octaprenyltransferase